MLRQLNQKNTITIPHTILKEIGVKPPVDFKITHNGQYIILIPKDREDIFTENEWAKLEKLSRKKGKIYTSPKDAKNHIRKLIK